MRVRQHGTREFLKALNSDGGKPHRIQTLREISRVAPSLSAHNLGTCVKAPGVKMGFATNGVRLTTSRTIFISDGSQLTTGAAANPTLTIVALAIRQADYIADQVVTQNI
jgi:choline dehydrogenase-like flavoprotein